ncbi:PIH1 domain-containing protein 2 [Erpetoichthys calabaricus]|uniref:PIH1D1/2/3 CS-like domain-containing protein n=1 Tax=Erpetoichthys calabaricus TaxID=27687 RepID=A0A8C4SUZ3_ERPCA|nr:PIH1 domain-containing protein 2 [Erpetoichthys calabaricus]XP_051787786.1 PIH1 domain-containing protein 2 [Erpetoichthys calabaricus]
MAIKLDQKDLLQHVNQFWSMLDEMSESNPEAYRKFIRHNMEEGIEHCAPPCPHTCVRTKIMEPEEDILYINLCTWNRVPPPSSDLEPVPLRAGQLEKVTEENEVYWLISIAYNPNVLQQGEQDHAVMEQLIGFAMKCTEQHHGLHLSKSYSMTEVKLKGTSRRMKDSLMNSTLPTPTHLDIKSIGQQKSLDQQIRTLTLGDEPEPICSLPFFGQQLENPKKTGLIEVISSTNFDMELPQTPKYHLSTVKNKNNVEEKIVLSVELPGVHSVSECDLSISQDDVLIEVQDKYFLHLDLSRKINDESASAKFNKRTQVLLVTLSIQE